MLIICCCCSFEGEQGICNEEDDEQDEEEDDEEEEKEQVEEEEEEEEEKEEADDDVKDDDDVNEEDKVQIVEEEETVIVDGAEVTRLLETEWIIPVWFGKTKFEVCWGICWGVTIGREQKVDCREDDDKYEDDNAGENEVELVGAEIESHKNVWVDWKSEEGVRTVRPKCSW